MPLESTAFPTTSSIQKLSSSFSEQSPMKPQIAIFLLAATTQKKDISGKQSNASKNQPILEVPWPEIATIT